MKRQLWEESKRWQDYVSTGLMFNLKNRKKVEMCLGPTHEEGITDLVRKFVTSHKQLPMILYQQNTKFRDELRPRFGLFRCCEFIMKDAYSFDYTTEGLDKSYAIMREAYQRIFSRCDLNFVSVRADSGAIGGTGSEEFMVLADTGEDVLCFCDTCNYAANSETAISKLPKVEFKNTDSEMVKLHTPNIRTVDQLVKFTGIAAHQMVKTILYKVVWSDREDVVAVMMRGDLEINEIKLKNHLDCLNLKTAAEEVVKELTQAEVGFAGPFGLPESVRVIGDKSIEEIPYFLCGLNETDYHNINVCFGRDLPLPELVDLKLARAGEACPECSDGTLGQKMGIEVGHIFKLGTKYSDALDATVLDENGKKVPLIMGCYGIGTSRIIAAVIEQMHDERGILWPKELSPFQIQIVTMGNDEELMNGAEALYQELQKAGIEVLFDDRDVSAGFKFKDADLLGIPHRVIFGRGFKNDGKAEVECRKTKEKKSMTVEEVLQFCLQK
jgi:prolyl-tRNA synthetase